MHSSIYPSIFNHLRAIARHWSEIATFPTPLPLHLTPPLGMFPLELREKFGPQKTRIMGLPGSEDSLTIGWAVRHNTSVWRPLVQPISRTCAVWLMYIKTRNYCHCCKPENANVNNYVLRWWQNVSWELMPLMWIAMEFQAFQLMTENIRSAKCILAPVTLKSPWADKMYQLHNINFLSSTDRYNVQQSINCCAFCRQQQNAKIYRLHKFSRDKKKHI